MSAAHLRSANLTAEAWAEVQEDLDRQLSPLGLAAIEALSLQRGEAVLDVGCGAGQTVLQIAKLIGTKGSVTGVDLSPLLLRIARRRADHLRQTAFIEADAQKLDLPSYSFDVVFSRFGVMAFADPPAAFRNFHRLLKPGGRISFVCWRALEDNELDYLPLKSAGLEDKVDLTPFSLADEGRIRAILEAAGFRRVVLQAHDHRVSSGDLDRTLAVLLKVGPLGRVLREHPNLRGEAEPRVRAALENRAGTPFGLNAATWVVKALAAPA